MRPAIIAVAILLLGIITVFRPGDTELSPKEFSAALHADPQAVLIDLRTPEQFYSGHLPGAANITWNAPGFQWKIAAQATDKSLYLYSDDGKNYEAVIAYCESRGFLNHHLLRGGLREWKTEKMPVTPEELIPPEELCFDDFCRLLELQHLVLVDFFLQADKNCRQTEPVVDAIAMENGTAVRILRINVDKYKHLATEMGIDNVPVLQFYANGNLVAEVSGVCSKSEIEKKLRFREYVADN